jgi:biotin carboxylase
MVRVVFVAPFAADTTLRFVRCAAELPDVRMAVITQDDPEKLPEPLRARLVAVRRVGNALDAGELASAVRALEAQLGGPAERLIGVLEQLQVPLAEVREQLRIRGMDAQEARNFRDKSRMKDVLRAHGLPCAQHRLCPTETEALEFAARAGFPLVAKPPAGAGARNTLRVENMDELHGYLRSAPPSQAAPLLLEEFITGEEFSFDTVTLHGRHLFHSINVYAPAPLTVLENAWIQWAVLLPRRIDTPEFAPIFDAGPRALDALGMHTGVTHMEWFRRPDGRIAISEVAARPPGAQFTTLISYAHDFDLYTAWARLVIHEQFDAPQRQFSVGAAYLRGQGEGRVVAIEGLDDVRRELGPLVVEWKPPALGASASGTYEGEGFIIVRHPDTAAVRDALTKIVRTVRVRLG